MFSVTQLLCEISLPSLDYLWKYPELSEQTVHSVYVASIQLVTWVDCNEPYVYKFSVVVHSPVISRYVFFFLMFVLLISSSQSLTCLSILSSSLYCVADIDSRRRLTSSADTNILLVPRSRLVTVGDRSFPVTKPRTWNNLPASIRSAPSLLSFKRQLKHIYFLVVIPDIVIPNLT